MIDPLLPTLRRVLDTGGIQFCRLALRRSVPCSILCCQGFAVVCRCRRRHYLPGEVSGLGFLKMGLRLRILSTTGVGPRPANSGRPLPSAAWAWVALVSAALAWPDGVLGELKRARLQYRRLCGRDDFGCAAAATYGRWWRRRGMMRNIGRRGGPTLCASCVPGLPLTISPSGKSEMNCSGGFEVGCELVENQ